MKSKKLVKSNEKQGMNKETMQSWKDFAKEIYLKWLSNSGEYTLAKLLNITLEKGVELECPKSILSLEFAVYEHYWKSPNIDYFKTFLDYLNFVIEIISLGGVEHKKFNEIEKLLLTNTYRFKYKQTAFDITKAVLEDETLITK